MCRTPQTVSDRPADGPRMFSGMRFTLQFAVRNFASAGLTRENGSAADVAEPSKNRETNYCIR